MQKMNYKRLLTLFLASTISSANAMNSDDSEPVHNIRKLNLSQGNTTFQNEHEAVEYYQKTASSGDLKAQLKLAEMYAKGEGLPKDDKQAVKYYQLAADQGNAEAQYNLGMNYSNGQGVEQSDKEAVVWLRKAAEQGYVEAQCRLGLKFKNGAGVTRDSIEATKWYRKAADQGYAEGQYQLGKMLDESPESMKWIRLAAGQGHDLAKRYLEDIQERDVGVANAYRMSQKEKNKACNIS